jgi:hypothetical protein
MYSFCDVGVVCCVNRGLCDELITHPEEYYRMWRLVVCDLEISKIGRSAIKKKKEKRKKEKRKERKKERI